MTIKDLREKRANALEQMKDLQKRAQGENRSLSTDEQTQWDNWNKDFDSASEEIQRLENLRQKEELLAGQQQETEQRQAKPEYDNVFVRYLRGQTDFSIPEKELLAQHRGTATQISSTTTLGGYTVPKQFSNELERTMADFGGVLQASRIIDTSKGGTFEYPKLDDTATSANWITQGNEVTTQDLTFAQETFSDYTIATLVKVSFQMMSDEAINLLSELALIMGERLGRGLNTALTTGDGSGKPTGFITSASTGETAGASTLTRDNILDLIHSVDAAYRRNPSAALMFNDTTLAYIKKLAIGSSDDRPLWVPSMRDGAPDTIEGYRYVINNDMANIGTTNKSMAFGDWSKYIIRRAGADSMLRLNERFADALTVGFVLYGRYDGKLLNTAAIKVLAHA